MRIRGLDEETEEALEDYEELKGKIADLTKTDATPGGISLFTDASKTEFKSTYQILKEISQVWDKINDKNQAALLEALAGKRGGQVLAGILNDFSSVDEALKTMEESGGSAQRELGIVQESIDYKINKLKETWTGFLQETVSRDFLGDWVDRFTALSEVVTSLTSKLGIFRTVFMSLGTVIGSQKLSVFKYIPGQGIDIPSAANPTLSLSQMDYATRIQGIMTNANAYGFKPEDTIHMVEDLNNEMSSLDASTKDWGKQIASSNRNLKQGVTYTADLVAYQKQVNGLGAKFKNIIGNGIAMIGNALMSMGISWLISTGLGLIIKGIDNIVHKAEHIKEAAEEARQAIRDINDDFSNTQKTVSDLGDRYAELAQQVGNLGTANQNQGGLSNDEYQEFLDISNKLAEVFPTLTKGYTDNGDAILDLSGNVDTIVTSLNELVKVEQELANQKVLENMDKIWQDFGIEIDNAREKIEEAKRSFEGAGSSNGTADAGWKEQLDVFNTIIGEGKNRTWGVYGDPESINIETKYLQDAFKIANVEWNKIVHDGIFHVEDLEETEIDKIRRAFQTLKANYESEIKGYENEIKKQNFEMGKYVAQSIKTGGYYEQLNDAEKKIAEGYTLNLDYDKLLDENGDWETTFNRIQDQLRNTFENITPANKMLVQKYYDEMFSIDLSDGSYQDNLDKIMQYARLIVSILGDEFSTFDIIQALGLDSAFGKRDTARQKLGYSDNPREAYQAKRNNEINDFLSTLSSDDYDKFNVEFSFDKNASMEEIKKLWEDFQNYADSNPIEPEISASEAVDSMNDAKTAITSLEGLYEQTVTKAVKDGLATGYADPATLTSIRTAFDKFSDDLEKKGDKQGAETINQALKDFETTLVEFPNDADKAQKAMNELITKYIDQTDIIKNLDEANAEWSKEQLKTMGITNAEEVVQSRLNKQVRATTKAISELSRVLRTYNDALESGDENEKAKAISGLVDPTKEALTIRDENGEALQGGYNDFINNINDGFVKSHLEDIQAMADGDIEALNRVRLAAAKGAVMEVTTNVPTEAAEAQIQGLMDMVAQADAMNIEPGASIDDSQFIGALNNMIRSAGLTEEQVNAAFQGMGYEAKWKSNPYKVKYTEAQVNQVAGKDTKAASMMMKTQEAEVDFPSLEIITKKGSSGTGAVANYGGGTNTGTGGGDGGGGGGGGDSSNKNKVNKDTKESFDWIEVKLKRLQEAIDRLDKTATNVFEGWTKRNNALADEIKKVTKQIEVQEHAAKRYAKNASKVSNKNTNIKPKASDYDKGKKDKQYKYDLKQYKKAAKEWATGEYQEKIEKGLIGKGDIEKIKNKYLVALINEYTEEYQKSVDAADAAEDARIHKLELEKQKLDNIIEKWEEQIKLIQQSTDVLDEYVNRTESLGYFVNTKDMKRQSKLLKDQRDETKKELDEAVTTFNDLVKRGVLVKGTQAYSEAEEQVFNIYKDYESLNTKYMEQEKKIRESTWERFDYLQERLDDIVKESEYVQKLVQSEKMMDEYGNLNNRGYTNMAMIGVQYDEAARKVADYKKARKDFEDVMDWTNKDDVKHWQDLTDAIRDAGNSMMDAKESAKSFFEEIINTHLNKLKELMDEYKNTLSAAKDLYDFQKNIGNQTKNIENLRKQLVAYQGDDSEAGRKRRQELTNQLNAAEEQLQETEWDRYISQTGEMLDNLYGDYEETLNARLDNVDALVKELVIETNANKEAVKAGLKEIKDEYGATIDNFKPFMEGNTTNLVTSLQNGTLGTGVTAISTAVTDIKNKVAKMIDNPEVSRKLFQDSFDFFINKDGTISVKPVIDDKKASGGGSAGGGDSKKSDENNDPKWSQTEDLRKQINDLETKIAETRALRVNESAKKKPDQKKLNEYDKSIADDTVKLDNLKRQLDEVSTLKATPETMTNTRLLLTDEQKKAAVEEVFKNEELFVKAQKKKSKYGKFNQYVYENNDGYIVKSAGLDELRAIMGVGDNDELINALKKIKGDIKGVKGFAKGSKSISASQLAWTNENWEKNGGELIFRKSDGAVLTPLNQGDMVFTADMTQRLWEIAQGMVPTSVGGQKLPNISSNNHSTVNTNNQITISLPNVNDYDSFKRELQNDSRFEKFIQEVTIGQAMGNNTLNKRKY